MRRILMIGLAIFAIAVPGGITMAAKADKADICHQAGNGKYVLLSAHGNSWAAHQAHGDVLAVEGACPSGSGG
jgi:hypothetical protein